MWESPRLCPSFDGLHGLRGSVDPPPPRSEAQSPACPSRAPGRGDARTAVPAHGEAERGRDRDSEFTDRAAFPAGLSKVMCGFIAVLWGGTQVVPKPVSRRTQMLKPPNVCFRFNFLLSTVREAPTRGRGGLSSTFLRWTRRGNCPSATLLRPAGPGPGREPGRATQVRRQLPPGQDSAVSFTVDFSAVFFIF